MVSGPSLFLQKTHICPSSWQSSALLSVKTTSSSSVLMLTDIRTAFFLSKTDVCVSVIKAFCNLSMPFDVSMFKPLTFLRWKVHCIITHYPGPRPVSRIKGFAQPRLRMRLAKGSASSLQDTRAYKGHRWLVVASCSLLALQATRAGSSLCSPLRQYVAPGLGELTTALVCISPSGYGTSVLQNHFSM